MQHKQVKRRITLSVVEDTWRRHADGEADDSPDVTEPPNR
jgi:hypothetical protein